MIKLMPYHNSFGDDKQYAIFWTDDDQSTDIYALSHLSNHVSSKVWEEMAAPLKFGNG